MFYLNDYLTCKKGEEVKGTFKMVPNERNNRDMDFNIKIEFNVSRVLCDWIVEIIFISIKDAIYKKKMVLIYFAKGFDFFRLFIFLSSFISEIN